MLYYRNEYRLVIGNFIYDNNLLFNMVNILKYV